MSNTGAVGPVGAYSAPQTACCCLCSSTNLRVNLRPRLSETFTSHTYALQYGDNLSFSYTQYCTTQSAPLPDTIYPALLQRFFDSGSAPSVETYVLTTREAAWHIMVLSVCLYVCMSVCHTLGNLDVESSYLHMRYISTDYGSVRI